MKTNQLKAGKVMLICGIALISLGAMYFAIAIFAPDLLQVGTPADDILEQEYIIFTGIVCSLIGVVLSFIALPKRAKARRLNSYKDFILISDERDINKLASLVGIPPEQAMIDIYKLIATGILGDAQINHEKRRIERPDVDLAKKIKETQIAEAAAAHMPKQKNISCPGCGVNTVVAENVIAECKYCSSKLTYD